MGDLSVCVGATLKQFLQSPIFLLVLVFFSALEIEWVVGDPSFSSKLFLVCNPAIF